MHAVRIDRPSSIQSVQMDIPAPRSDEVLVRVDTVGICGSDVELLAGTRPEAFSAYPIVPGHEWAGRIAELGTSVTGLQVDDAVVAEGFRNCEMCPACRAGHTNLCSREYAETGFTHQGAFAEYVAVPARLVHQLPPDADLSAAAAIEPAACVAEGLLNVEHHTGLDVAVIGLGTLGMIAIEMLKLDRPARLVAIGTRPSRLRLAESLGAGQTIDASDNAAMTSVRAAFDIVFEAASRPHAAATALSLARRGGSVVLAGIYAPGPPNVESNVIAVNQLTVRGVFGASHRAWDWIIDLFARGCLDLGGLITHRLPLGDFASAFALLADRQADALKVQLQP